MVRILFPPAVSHRRTGLAASRGFGIDTGPDLTAAGMNPTPQRRVCCGPDQGRRSTTAPDGRIDDCKPNVPPQIVRKTLQSGASIDDKTGAGYSRN
jgi:hypothetical protein